MPTAKTCASKTGCDRIPRGEAAFCEAHTCTVRRCALELYANGMCEGHNRRQYNWERGVRGSIPLDAPIQARTKAAGRHTIRLGDEQEASIIAHLKEVDCSKCRPGSPRKSCKKCRGSGLMKQSVYSKLLEIIDSWATRNPAPNEGERAAS